MVFVITTLEVIVADVKLVSAEMEEHALVKTKDCVQYVLKASKTKHTNLFGNNDVVTKFCF